MRVHLRLSGMLGPRLTGLELEHGHPPVVADHEAVDDAAHESCRLAGRRPGERHFVVGLSGGEQLLENGIGAKRQIETRGLAGKRDRVTAVYQVGASQKRPRNPLDRRRISAGRELPLEEAMHDRADATVCGRPIGKRPRGKLDCRQAGSGDDLPVAVRDRAGVKDGLGRQRAARRLGGAIVPSRDTQVEVALPRSPADDVLSGRLREGREIAAFDRRTLYTAGAEGYIDYPTLG